MKPAAALVVVLLVAIGCSRKPIDPFPSEVSGWTKTGTTRTFAADGLATYIDGDAERFVKAGFEKVLTADYRHGENVEAVADVFAMRDAAAARTILENEPGAGSRPLTIGDSGRAYGQSVTFRKQKYYVRVVAYSESAAIVDLAKGIAARLK